MCTPPKCLAYNWFQNLYWKRGREGETDLEKMFNCTLKRPDNSHGNAKLQEKL